MNLHAGLPVQCESIPPLFARAHRMTGFEAQVQGPDEIGIFPLLAWRWRKRWGTARGR